MRGQGRNIATWTLLLVLGTASNAFAASEWLPERELIPGGGVLGVQSLYVLPNGTAGAIITGPGFRTADLDATGTPAGSFSPPFGDTFNTGGVAESSTRTTMVWTDYDGKAHAVTRAAGAPAFGPVDDLVLDAAAPQWVTAVRSNAAGDEVFGYATPDGDGHPVAHLVTRPAGSSSWTDEALFDDAGVAAAGISASRRIVLVLYADDAYWLTWASWDGEFSKPQWIGDNDDGVSDFTFQVNAPGDALVSWNTDAAGDASHDPWTHVVAYLGRDGTVVPADPVPGSEWSGTGAPVVLDDTGRVTAAFTRGERKGTRGVLFVRERTPSGTWGAPLTPAGLVIPDIEGVRLSGDAVGNAVLAYTPDGKFGYEAVRRTADGHWGAPQDLQLPCPSAYESRKFTTLRVHGGLSTAVMIKPTGPTYAGAATLVSRERPASVDSGRVCGTPRFAERSPFDSAPPAGVSSLPSPNTTSRPRPVPMPWPSTPSAPAIRLTNVRVLGQPTRRSRSVLVRASCSRACALTFRVFHRPSGATLGVGTARLTRPGSAEVTVRLRRRALARWRTARPGTIRLLASATWTGVSSAHTSIAVPVRAARRR